MIASLTVKCLVCLCVIVLSNSAVGRDDAWQQRESNALWRAECGACHIAFPPALLAADDWLKIMSRLATHFGTEASLDATVRDEIAAYLARNGSGYTISSNISSDELPRITASGWFVRKHGGAIRLWRKGKVKSLADCAACHKGPDIETMKSD
jgi:hypothetical protein